MERQPVPWLLLRRSVCAGPTVLVNTSNVSLVAVWSHLYSLSFEPNPEWTREYSGQQEILDYLIGIATKYNLFRHIRFNTSVVGSRFDSASGTWTTTVRSGGGKAAEFTPEYHIRSRFIVSAVGQLNEPKIPSIPGLDTFHGKVMHSSRWDRSVPLAGKRIGVIGNGASAIQIVPELAKVASSVVVLQRSPCWIVPRNDRTISSFRRAVYRQVPLVRTRHRAQLMDAREAQYAALFDEEGAIHKSVKDATVAQMANALPGERHRDLRNALTPNYPPGCKRILISDDYFPALGRDNVTLETAPIVHVTRSGITTASGWNSKDRNHDAKDHELDIIVCATGFNATGFLAGMDIRNGAGESLQEYWSQGRTTTHLGISVPHFPNFAMLFGPNTNLGHNSIILMIEAQSRFINALIRKVLQPADGPSRTLSVEPREDVSRAWTAKVQAKLRQSTLASALCSSWYKTETGEIPTNWPEPVVAYQEATCVVQWSDFLLTGASGSKAPGEGSTSWRRVVEETRAFRSALSISGMVLGVAAGACWYARWTLF